MKLVGRPRPLDHSAAQDLRSREDNAKAAFMGQRHISLPTRANAPAVIWLVGLTCLPEVLLTLANAGLFDGAGLRRWAMMHGAFWNALLNGWEPVYAFQREIMFVSYAFLHGGFLHLIGNMLAVLALGGIVVARIGQQGFLLLYALSAIGGAIGFAILSNSEAPMIGASGAVFGLIGAWKFWEWQKRKHVGAPMQPLWRSLIGLVLLNVILWIALSGLLAWEAHLGGFVAGVIVAALATPTLRHRI